MPEYDIVVFLEGRAHLSWWKAPEHFWITEGRIKANTAETGRYIAARLLLSGVLAEWSDSLECVRIRSSPRNIWGILERVHIQDICLSMEYPHVS